jgi:hypothetical protein
MFTDKNYKSRKFTRFLIYFFLVHFNNLVPVPVCLHFWNLRRTLHLLMPLNTVLYFESKYFTHIQSKRSDDPKNLLLIVFSVIFTWNPTNLYLTHVLVPILTHFYSVPFSAHTSN